MQKRFNLAILLLLGVGIVFGLIMWIGAGAPM